MANKSIIEIILPSIKLAISNKIIKKQIKQIWNTNDAREYYSYRYRYTKIEDLEKLYSNGLSRKERLEDKGKSTLFTMTVVVTMFSGFISLLYNSSFCFINNIIRIITYSEIGLSIFYILLSAILNLYMLSERNIIYCIDVDYYNDNCIDTKKDKLGCIIDSNDLQNVIRNNYISSSFQCVINAAITILLFIVTIFINYQV
jgi:hypothetical protein